MSAGLLIKKADLKGTQWAYRMKMRSKLIGKRTRYFETGLGSIKHQTQRQSA